MGKSKDVKKEKKKPKSTAPKQSKSKKQYQLGKSQKDINENQCPL